MTQMWKEILDQPSALERCHNKNVEIIKNLVGIIREKNVDSICIAARGTSDHAAIYGKYILEILTGIPVSLSASSVFTVYQKNLKLDNSLVIAISQSGKAADALEVIRGANKAGALTVSITNFPDSPLAVEAQHHLCCEAGLEKSVAATKTFTTQLMLLAMLAAEWSGDNALNQELTLLPQKLSEVFDIAKEIEVMSKRYRFMNECFVLARGINYAICMEAALKMQETNYVRAKAFATSDFLHGPIAMIDKDIPVIIFAPNGPSLEDTRQMIDKLKQSSLELIVVSNNKEILDLGTVSFKIPETSNDFISPFFNVVVAQMFACQLALTKGLNPDSPRGLNKVTITK